MTTTDTAAHLASLTAYTPEEWRKALVHLPAGADDERLLPNLVELAKTMGPHAAVKASWVTAGVLRERDARC